MSDSPGAATNPAVGCDSGRQPVLVPVLGSLREPVRVSQWLVDAGEWVDARERVVELVAAGITVDLVAPCAGLLSEPLVRRGMAILPGEVVGWIMCANSLGSTVPSGSGGERP